MRSQKSWILSFVLIFLNSIYCSAASIEGTSDFSANDSILSRPMVDSIYICVGAGFLIGLATSSHFQVATNLNQIDMWQVMRGMSWGLYGGIVLGAWGSYVGYRKRQKNKIPEEDSDEARAATSISPPLRLGTRFIFSESFFEALSAVQVTPLFANNRTIDGLDIEVTLWTF